MRNALLTTSAAIGYAGNPSDATEFSTMIGRIVWGHPLKPQDKTDSRTNAKVLDDTGQPIKQWAFGVAFAKADFQSGIWPFLGAETVKGYPNGVPQGFSYKYQDGDDTNPVWNNGKQSKPYAERPGYPGCYVLTFSTEFQAPNVVQFVNGAYQQLQPDQIKTGDFVMVGASVKWHAGQSPGLYINPLTVLLCYEGDALGGSYTADPTQIFGNAPQIGAMPAGARPVGAPAPMGAVPQGTMPGMGMQQPQQAGGMPGNGMPGMATGAVPGQQPAQFAAPQAQNPAGGMPGVTGASPSNMPPPAQGFVANAGMPGNAPAGAPMQPGGMPGQMPQR